NKLAGQILTGVFGGDVETLSVRSVMPQFVAMEREHGSLIAALQHRERDSTSARQTIFTPLRRGVGVLVDALSGFLPREPIHMRTNITAMERSPSDRWSAVA